MGSWSSGPVSVCRGDLRRCIERRLRNCAQREATPRRSAQEDLQTLHGWCAHLQCVVCVEESSQSKATLLLRVKWRKRPKRILPLWRACSRSFDSGHSALVGWEVEEASFLSCLKGKPVAIVAMTASEIPKYPENRVGKIMSTPNERLVTAQWILERNLGWVAAAEIKVGAITAVDIAMLAALGASFSVDPSKSPWRFFRCLRCRRIADCTHLHRDGAFAKAVWPQLVVAVFLPHRQYRSRLLQ